MYLFDDTVGLWATARVKGWRGAGDRGPTRIPPREELPHVVGIALVELQSLEPTAPGRGIARDLSVRPDTMSDEAPPPSTRWPASRRKRSFAEKLSSRAFPPKDEAFKARIL